MFLKTRFYIALTVIVLLLGMGYAFPPLFVVGKVALALLALAVVADIGLLYYKRRYRRAFLCLTLLQWRRQRGALACGERLSLPRAGRCRR